MKFNYLKLTVIIISFSIIGCKKGGGEPKITTSNISRITYEDIGTCEITYDSNEYPILIKIPVGKNEVNLLEITYKATQVEKIRLIQKEASSTSTENFTISYPNINQVNILTDSKENRQLLFEKELLTDLKHINLLGSVEYMQKYFYNAESNLVRAEYYEGGQERSKTIEFFYNYDTNPNPFFAKAKIWAIIEAIYESGFSIYKQIPISKNNPKISSFENPYYSNGTKIMYEYNTNHLPGKLTFSHSSRNAQPPVQERPLPDGTEYKLNPFEISITY